MLTWSCFILRDEVRRSAFCASSSFSISFFWFLLDVSKSNSYFLSKSYKRKVTLAIFGLQNYTVLVGATKLNKRDEYVLSPTSGPSASFSAPNELVESCWLCITQTRVSGQIYDRFVEPSFHTITVRRGDVYLLK